MNGSRIRDTFGGGKNTTASSYSSFIKGFCHKVTYYMCTIKGASTQHQRADQVIQLEFKPTITGGINCNW